MTAALRGAASALPRAPDRGAWDLLVVGGGTAGLVGARTAASFGASVLMVERERPGGDCLWTGCVPSKALLAAASVAADARGGGRLGVHVDRVRIAFDEVMAHIRGAIATIEPVDSPEAMRAAGVAYAAGTATFTGPATATVDGTALRFRQALIATGSDPAVPPIPGLAEADPLTSDSVWDLTERPDRLVVMGAAPSGASWGRRSPASAAPSRSSRRWIGSSAMRTLTLPGPVTEALTDDGATVLTGTPVAAVEGADVVLGDGRRITVDSAPVAVGRRPDTRGLGLDAAGVATGDRGFVAVEAHLRTSNPGADLGRRGRHRAPPVHPCRGGARCHRGGQRGAGPPPGRRGHRGTAGDLHLPGGRGGWGGRGFGPHDDLYLAARRGGPRDRRGPHGGLHPAGAGPARPRRRCHGRGAAGGETLAELTLAVRRGLRPRDLAAVMHPYPTWGDGPVERRRCRGPAAAGGPGGAPGEPRVGRDTAPLARPPGRPRVTAGQARPVTTRHRPGQAVLVVITHSAFPTRPRATSTAPAGVRARGAPSGVRRAHRSAHGGRDAPCQPQGPGRAQGASRVRTAATGRPHRLIDGWLSSRSRRRRRARCPPAQGPVPGGDPVRRADHHRRPDHRDLRGPERQQQPQGVHRDRLAALGDAAQERQRPAVVEGPPGALGDRGERQERRAVDVVGEQHQQERPQRATTDLDVLPPSATPTTVAP